MARAAPSIAHKQSCGVSLAENAAEGGGDDDAQDHTADYDHDLLLLRCPSSSRERGGGGMVSVGAGWTQGAWNGSLSCSPLPVVGSEKHSGSQKGSGSPGQGWAPLLLLQPWVGRAELVALRPQADTGTRCWEQDRQLALCSGSELDHDLSLLFFCKGRDSHSLPVPGVHLVPFPPPRQHPCSLSAFTQSVLGALPQLCNPQDVGCSQWCGVMWSPLAAEGGWWG